MIKKSVLFSLIIVLASLAFISIGCGKSDSSGASGGSDNRGAAGELSATERAAQDAVLAEIDKRWIKHADGWITARVGGSAYAPEHYLAQVRDLSVQSVHTGELDESDKLNGVEWAGEVGFKETPYREAGDSGYVLDGMAPNYMQRAHGAWSPWTNNQFDTVRVMKVKGKWQVNDDTRVLRGTRPEPGDFEKAGVK